MKKKIISVAAVLLLLCCTVAGTVAWLSDKTDAVTNTFTVGDINITLAETTGTGSNDEYKMIPGKELAKDPKVTVEAKSEACWLFVKVEKSDNFTTFFDGYTMASGWTALSDDGVYYREVAASDSDQSYYVLADQDATTTTVGAHGSLVVLNTVTKEQLEPIAKGTATKPTLAFTAYAIQKEGINSASDAWSKLAS